MERLYNWDVGGQLIAANERIKEIEEALERIAREDEHISIWTLKDIARQALEKNNGL